ncbi:MAG: hypothetical protein FWG45_06345, partial [Oscillospiraceae bacterium]|nr:hypothetical protein [Oscillospiraceae bacterium]
RMYSVHETESGGRFYAFFEGQPTLSERSVLYNTIYVEKRLKKKDFSSVKVGDDIKKVEAIDPATTIWRQLGEANASDMDSTLIQSRHLLVDGLLEIDYRSNGNDDKIVIVTIVYYDDFKIIRHFAHEKFEGDIAYDYSVLRKDLPK